MATTSQQDYLKAIWCLDAAGASATTKALAERLAVSPASVSEMVRRLVEAKLVRRERYGPIALTATGRRAAARVVRKHRVIELFLHQVLGLPWEAVHDEAEQWEHAVSDEATERMVTILGRPEVDVHGHPIPDTSGACEPPADLPLVEARPGQALVVSQVADYDAQLLRYVGRLGLHPGAALMLEHVGPFGGPITCRIGEQSVALGEKVAAAVRVKAARGEENR